MKACTSVTENQVDQAENIQKAIVHLTDHRD